MRKFKLELDALEVETFVTHAETRQRGTVDGFAKALPTADGWCDTEECDDTVVDETFLPCASDAGLCQSGQAMTCWTCVPIPCYM